MIFFFERSSDEFEMRIREEKEGEKTRKLLESRETRNRNLT